MCVDSIQIRHRQPIHNLHFPPQLVQRNLRVAIAQRTGLCLGDEDKVVGEQPCALGDVVFGGEVGVDFAEVDDEGVFDAEDGVGAFVGVVAEVEGSTNTY